MKEEILERLVNELVAQNKLIALLIARDFFSSNALYTDEEKLDLIKEKSESILKWVSNEEIIKGNIVFNKGLTPS